MLIRFYWITLICICQYFLITTDFDLAPSYEIALVPIQTEPSESVGHDDGLTEQDYLELVKLERVARSISRKYRHIDYREAMRVVSIADREAKKHNFSLDFVLGVIATESSFNRKAQSHVGAKGYMQIIPRWHQNRIRGRDIYNTEVNIEVGVAFLRECIDRRGSRRSGLACYNGATTVSNIDAYNNSVAKNATHINNIVASL